MTHDKAINWLESTRRSLQARVPETSDSAPYLTERLSELFLQRLPTGLGNELLGLLPQDAGGDLLERRSGHHPEYSIGYSTFVEQVRHSLGMTDLLDATPYDDSEESFAALCDRVADAFLWAVAQEFPVELKFRVADHLPSDLSCRMNLYSGYSDSDKVA
jgi:hypothetical protein